MTRNNRRIVADAYGGPDVLRTVEEPLRPPERTEVRVKVEAAGVALADVMRRKGVYPNGPFPPFTPGYDAVGTIDECGADVRQFARGDRIGVFFPGSGGYAAYVYADENEVVPAPPRVDAAEAAAVLLNYVTAYQMLHRIARVAAGERILIHGAAGGVGTALLELGRLAETTMYGTASSAKHPVVAAFGATPIDYRSEDFVQAIRRLHPDGIDAVFDPIGGEHWSRSFKTLRRAGRFVGYGFTSALDPSNEADWARAWGDVAIAKRTDAGSPAYVYSVTTLRKERPDWYREDAAALLSLLERGAIRPLVSHRVPFAEAAEAHRLLETSASIGKVVLVME